MGNVVGVLENVEVERRKNVWTQLYMGHIMILVRDPLLEEIYQKYSTEEQRIHACADIYINCNPNTSWTEVCQGLYRENEIIAARKAKTFIPQTGEQWGQGQLPCCELLTKGVDTILIVRGLDDNCVQGA